MTEQRKYFAIFSHEFEPGHSGAARSYWEICYGLADHYRVISTICLHHREHGQPQLTADQIAHELNVARRHGRDDKAAEVRTVLGLREPRAL